MWREGESLVAPPPSAMAEELGIVLDEMDLSVVGGASPFHQPTSSGRAIGGGRAKDRGARTNAMPCSGFRLRRAK